MSDDDDELPEVLVALDRLKGETRRLVREGTRAKSAMLRAKQRLAEAEAALAVVRIESSQAEAAYREALRSERTTTTAAPSVDPLREATRRRDLAQQALAESEAAESRAMNDLAAGLTRSRAAGVAVLVDDAAMLGGQMLELVLRLREGVGRIAALQDTTVAPGPQRRGVALPREIESLLGDISSGGYLQTTPTLAEQYRRDWEDRLGSLLGEPLGLEDADSDDEAA
jgi:hypothetical protein